MKALPLGPDPALDEGPRPSQGNNTNQMRCVAALHLAASVGVLLFSSHAAGQERPKPPPNSLTYFQYGVALAAETVGSAADVCPDRSGQVPCILGSGGG